MRYLHLRPALPPPQPLPPVVFVHGLMGYTFSWRHNLEFFAQHRDVYALDLLGIGHSDRPEPCEADFSLPAAAARLLNFLHAVVRKPADLVATSHGGAVAMLAASQDRLSSATPLIRRLALIAPANPFMPNARLRLAFFRTPFGRMVLRGLGSRGGSLRSKSIGRMYSDDSLITPETRAGYAVNLEDPRSYAYASEVIRTWRSDMQRLQAALHSIAAIPVLLLWGADDKAVSPASGLLLREFFRDVQYIVLPKVGHLPYEEAPADFNRLVLQFLES
jgi:pimeloyl-ACP methyl ester carboxylesterase